MDHLAKTSEELMEERDLVLHYSSEVLARVAANINNEDTFLMDYDNERIEIKVNQFMANHRVRSNEGFRKFLDGNIYYRDRIEEGITEVSIHIIFILVQHQTVGNKFCIIFILSFLLDQ